MEQTKKEKKIEDESPEKQERDGAEIIVVEELRQERRTKKTEKKTEYETPPPA